jgi:hypothetical protein
VVCRSLGRTKSAASSGPATLSTSQFPSLPATTSTPVRVLLLWDYLDGQTLDQFTLRIVHTLAPGVHGQAVPCDLIVDVKDGGTIFSHLKFPGSPEHDDFFMVEIAVEEEGDSGS